MRLAGLKLFFFIIACFLFCFYAASQKLNDSTLLRKDSAVIITDTIQPANILSSKNKSLTDILKNNTNINLSTTSNLLLIKKRNHAGKEFLFYLLGSIVFLLALFKVFYSRYFNNIFRVFFNTSLRQNQLTDLLLQARLPSMLFNIFFMISAGIYAWLLLKYYNPSAAGNNYVLISLSIAFIGCIYAAKYFVLKLIGWISGITHATDQYIFVIFLINKITGVVLIPFIILLAFAPAGWLNVIITISIITVIILFVLRHLRSYGLLKNQLKTDRLHFLIYIAGAEVLPMLILYKIVTGLITHG